MSDFQDGETLYHKATSERCVVIKTNKDGTVKVRTQKDVERDYYPQELRRPVKLGSVKKRMY